MGAEIFVTKIISFISYSEKNENPMKQDVYIRHLYIAHVSTPHFYKVIHTKFEIINLLGAEIVETDRRFQYTTQSIIDWGIFYCMEILQVF